MIRCLRLNWQHVLRQPGILISRTEASRPSFGIVARCMAGHSKWQNIKHIKAAKDAQKQAVANQVVNRIKVAIREGGGNTDPQTNYKLAQIIRYAMSQNVTKSTWEKAVKDYGKSKDAGTQFFIECKGPANCLLIIEGLSDKHKFARQTVVHVLKKYGGAIGNKGFSTHAFDFKGILNVPLAEDEKIDLDKATELAIEVEAEDVSQTTDENNVNILQFLCDPKDLHVVKNNLESADKNVAEAYLAYVPKNFTQLTPEQLDVLGEAVAELEALDFVMRVFDNAELKES